MRKVLTRWIACILSLVMMIETCLGRGNGNPPARGD